MISYLSSPHICRTKLIWKKRTPPGVIKGKILANMTFDTDNEWGVADYPGLPTFFQANFTGSITTTVRIHVISTISLFGTFRWRGAAAYAIRPTPCATGVTCSQTTSVPLCGSCPDGDIGTSTTTCSRKWERKIGREEGEEVLTLFPTANQGFEEAEAGVTAPDHFWHLSGDGSDAGKSPIPLSSVGTPSYQVRVSAVWAWCVWWCVCRVWDVRS
jgi:hypothetical protein